MVFFQLFSNNPNIVHVAAGQVLFAAGDEGHLMYVLTDGEADIVINNRTVDTLQRGNIVGEMEIVSPGPRAATVVANTDCQFVAIDEARFQYLVQQTPFFAMQVLRVLAERLRAADKLVAPLEDI